MILIIVGVLGTLSPANERVGGEGPSTTVSVPGRELTTTLQC
jgi:hypothetical protein